MAVAVATVVAVMVAADTTVAAMAVAAVANKKPPCGMRHMVHTKQKPRPSIQEPGFLGI